MMRKRQDIYVHASLSTQAIHDRMDYTTKREGLKEEMKKKWEIYKKKVSSRKEK